MCTECHEYSIAQWPTKMLFFYWSIFFSLFSGEVLGALCKKIGPAVYENCKSTILEGIRSNLERERMSVSSQQEQEETDKLMEKLSSSPARVRKFVCAV